MWLSLAAPAPKSPAISPQEEVPGGDPQDAEILQQGKLFEAVAFASALGVEWSTWPESEVPVAELERTVLMASFDPSLEPCADGVFYAVGTSSEFGSHGFQWCVSRDGRRRGPVGEIRGCGY